jgi:tRNA (guanosine-2'-O-)-methyltransferase
MKQYKDLIPGEAWSLLRHQLTEERQQKMQLAASLRTSRLRLVVQDIHDPHNVSACLRSAEAFGILNCDVVNLKRSFRPTTTARGVENWLRVHAHPDIESCVSHLRQSGYQLAAGFPSPQAKKLDDLPIDKPLALIFGNEHDGVSAQWLPHLDYTFTIPMVGLVESLNISVSAAISLYVLSQKAQNELKPEDYFLQENQREQLLSEWICGQLRSWPEQLAHLKAKQSQPREEIK